MNLNTSSEVETRTKLDELCNFDKKGLFDLGHPLVNRIAESFVKAAGIGAVQAVSRAAYFSAIDGTRTDDNGVKASSDGSAAGKRRLPGLRGETSNKSLEAMVINAWKESLQWGVAAGLYSGLTYGLKEARGAHDWLFLWILINEHFMHQCMILMDVAEQFRSFLGDFNVLRNRVAFSGGWRK